MKVLLLLFVLLLTGNEMIKGLNMEPCSDMTKAPPTCKYPPPRIIHKTLMNVEEGTIISDIIAGRSYYSGRDHFMLMKSVPNINNAQQLFISSYASDERKEFGQVLRPQSIMDDCGGSLIENESIRFLNSSGFFLLSGWFTATKPVCIGNFTISTLTSAEQRKVPFLIILSPNTATVLSVIQMENDFADHALVGLDTDQQTDTIYVLLQKGSMVRLGIYKNGQLLATQQITQCYEKCQVVGFHYSVVYARLVISFYEKEQDQLFVGQESSVLKTSYKTALWSLLYNPTVGSIINTHRLFYSTSTSVQIPKVIFSNVGKMIIIHNCQISCFFNNVEVPPSIYLVQYDFIKTLITYTKRFTTVENTSLLKIQSIYLERDLTINTIISGYNISYSIMDNENRTFTAKPFNVYQFRFRYKDGKIMQVFSISDDSSKNDNFLTSISSPIVNKDDYVDEYQPILFLSKNSGRMDLIVYCYLRSGYNGLGGYRDGREGFIATEPVFGVMYGSSSAFSSTKSNTYAEAIKSISFSVDDFSLCRIIFEYESSIEQKFGGCFRTSILQTYTITFEKEEYITKFIHSYRHHSKNLNCWAIVTNKRTVGCNYGNEVEEVPPNAEIVRYLVDHSGDIISITYFYGNRRTYSCESGTHESLCKSKKCEDIGSCNGGQCIGKNQCSCSNTVIPLDSLSCLPYTFCNGSSMYDTNQCGGRGKSQIDCSCKCDIGYYGTNCEFEHVCFGKNKDSFGSCSNNGICADTDKCECYTGFYGDQCNIHSCFGILSNDSSVCSRHGSCSELNVCSCKQGYYGDRCENYNCNGTINTSPTVCSEKGRCIDINNCSCLTGYSGDFCEQFTCNGTHFLDSGVCSGRGVCYSLDSCQCSHHSHGKNCELCATGHFGEKCENWTCQGKTKTEEAACNYRGICSSYNNCKCTKRATGKYCEQCIGYNFGLTCSDCPDGHFGYDCSNSLENSTVMYEIIDNDFVGFHLYAHSYSYGIPFFSCRTILRDPGALSHSISCRKEFISVLADSTRRYRIDVWIRKNQATFNPEDLIYFNILFAYEETPIYIPLKLDLSNFLQKFQGNYNGGNLIVSNSRTHATALNRCYESVISIPLYHPEHGSFRSSKWELVGDSLLLNNTIITNAIQNAQNKLQWTLPYFPTLHTIQKLEIGFSVVTNFNLTYSTIATFTMGGSYPREFINSRNQILLTSKEYSVPISHFFEENKECVDGRTMKAYTGSDVKLVVTKDSFIISSYTFDSHFSANIIFRVGGYLLFNVKIQPPKVYIKETIIHTSNPFFTVVCENYYGKVDRVLDLVWIMENTIAYKMYRYSEPISVDARELYPNFLGDSRTLTVSCMRTTYNYNLENLKLISNYPSNFDHLVIGKSVQSISFSSEKVDSSSCKVISATLLTKVPNLIPFSEDTLDLNLEILTTASTNCKVDISYKGSESILLETVNGTLTRYIVPFKFKDNHLIFNLQKHVRIDSDFFKLSLMGASDLSDYPIFISVQKPPSFKDCSIWPSEIYIGLTNAELNCLSSLSSTWSLGLLIDENEVANSVSFPLQFKATKISNNFNLLIRDSMSGGQITTRIYLVNNIIFNTDYLFSNDIINDISSSISNEKYHTKNDLIITLISNMKATTNESILDEILKIAPLALKATTTSLSNELHNTLSQGTSVSVVDMDNYINQVKVLSNPQYLTDETSKSTLDILNKFLEVSKKTSVWTSSSTTALSGILLNVATKISEISTIKAASSIAREAISLGSKTSLTTTDFFPNEKPSNLVLINALKTSASSLKNIPFGSSTTTSLLSFELSSLIDKIVEVSSSLFKFPTTTRRADVPEKKDYIVQLTISNGTEGSVHVNIPISSHSAPSDPSSTRQIFRCSYSTDFVKFETETICKSVKSFSTIVSQIKPSPQETLLVDCLCDLVSLTRILNSESTMIGITAEYVEEAIIDPEQKEETEKKGDVSESDQSSIAAVVVLIVPILLCFIVIPSVVIYIVRKKKKESSKTQTQDLSNQKTHETVEKVSSITTSNNHPQAIGQVPQNDNYSIAMKTFSSKDFV